MLKDTVKLNEINHVSFNLLIRVSTAKRQYVNGVSTLGKLFNVYS